MEDIKLYIAEIRDYPLLTPEQEKELGKKILEDDDEDAVEQLVLGNLRLVISIAKSYYTNTSLSLMDLIQEGNIGLLKAAKKYDYRVGTKFSTYATWWIRQAISQAVTDNSRTIRIPLHGVLELNKIKKAITTLEKEGKEPTYKAISELVKLKEDRVKLLLEIDSTMLSLDYDYNSDEDKFNLTEIINNKSITPEEYYQINSNKEELNKILNTLSTDEAKAIKLRFGLLDGEEKTYEEMGSILGLTKEGARQLSLAALKKLKQPNYLTLLKEIVF